MDNAALHSTPTHSAQLQHHDNTKYFTSLMGASPTVVAMVASVRAARKCTLATGLGKPISMAVALYRCMGLMSPSNAAYARPVFSGNVHVSSGWPAASCSGCFAASPSCRVVAQDRVGGCRREQQCSMCWVHKVEG